MIKQQHTDLLDSLNYKLGKKKKKYQKKDEITGINVKCEHCKKTDYLKGLSAWSFIIMEEYICGKCKKKTPLTKAYQN